MPEPRSDPQTRAGVARQRGLVVKVADAREREVALARRAEIYTRELGYHGLDEYDKIAIHLVAIDDQHGIVGAVRLLGPKPLPLEVASFLPSQVLANLEGRIGQIGGLWVTREGRRVIHTTVSLALLDFSLSVAARLRLTALVLRTVPSLQDYYRMVRFRSLGRGIFPDPHWGEVAVMVRGIPESCGSEATGSVAA